MQKIRYILQGEDAWKISFNGHFYSLNTLGKIIFQLILEGYSNYEISSKLHLQGYRNVADTQIQMMRESIERGKSKSKSTPIRFRITILDLKRWQRVLGNLIFLFNPYVALGIFCTFLLLFFVQYEEIVNSIQQSRVSIVGILVNVFITLFLMLFHEFGHAEIQSTSYRNRFWSISVFSSFVYGCFAIMDGIQISTNYRRSFGSIFSVYTDDFILGIQLLFQFSSLCRSSVCYK